MDNRYFFYIYFDKYMERNYIARVTYNIILCFLGLYHENLLHCLCYIWFVYCLRYVNLPNGRFFFPFICHAKLVSTLLQPSLLYFPISSYFIIIKNLSRVGRYVKITIASNTRLLHSFQTAAKHVLKIRRADIRSKIISRYFLTFGAHSKIAIYHA